MTNTADHNGYSPLNAPKGQNIPKANWKLVLPKTTPVWYLILITSLFIPHINLNLLGSIIECPTLQKM